MKEIGFQKVIGGLAGMDNSTVLSFVSDRAN